MTSNVFIFIMAGGSGERFWPMSRARHPKHLLKLLSEKTMLAETVERLRGLCPPEQLFVLTNSQQRQACVDALPAVAPAQIVAEPCKRDTAPAAALATALARSRNPKAVCLLLPADATIHDVAALRTNLGDALGLAAATEDLITLGIPPQHASTAFGYLQLDGEESRLEGGSRTRAVARFVEKPDADTAEGYLQSGGYFWNAGIFLWQAGVFLDLCRQFAPSLADFIGNFPAGDFNDYLEKHFPTLEKISVDYAILERAPKVRCVLADFDWDDLGSWTALPAHLSADGQFNTLRGPTAVSDSHNNIAISNGRLIALCGVSDLVVVETPDAILVCHRSAAQNIKRLQSQLPEELR